MTSNSKYQIFCFQLCHLDRAQQERLVRSMWHQRDGWPEGWSCHLPESWRAGVAAGWEFGQDLRTRDLGSYSHGLRLLTARWLSSMHKYPEREPGGSCVAFAWPSLRIAGGVECLHLADLLFTVSALQEAFSPLFPEDTASVSILGCHLELCLQIGGGEDGRINWTGSLKKS